MAASIAKLAILLTADTGQMQAGFKRAEGSVMSFSGVVSKAQGIIAGMMAGAGAAGIVGWGVKLAAEAEQAQAAFTVLLGSAEQAKKMFGDLKAFAARTPLQLGDTQDAARLLSSFGVANERIMPTLQMLGDISGGNAQRFQSLSLAFGQMSAAGRLMGQDLLQMINAGFNPLQIISQKTGISIGELKKKMEEGAISAEMVTEAFRAATSEGGMFFGMMDKQAATLTGRWNILKSQAAELARSFGELIAPAVGKLLDVGTALVQNFSRMDMESAKVATQMLAGAAAFTAVVFIVPKVVAAFTSLIAAYRALTTAQAISQAFSGPKGWAVLAASAVAATAAVYGVEQMFDGMGASQAEAAKQAVAVAESVKTQTTAFDALKGSIGESQKQLDDLKKRGESLTQSLRTPVESFAAAMQEANQLVESGAISWEIYARAVSKAEADLKRATAAKKSMDAPQSVGAADRYTVAGFSAVNQAKLADQKKIELQQQHLAEEKRQTALIAEGNRIARENRPPPTRVVTSL